MIVTIFKRHIYSIIFLGLYFVWWTLFIYWFHSGSSDYPHSCGAGNGALVVLTFLLVLIYTVILFIKIISAKGQERWDYLKFLGLVLLPAIALLIYETTVVSWTRIN